MAETLAARAEVHRQPLDSTAFGIVQKPLSTWERIYNQGAVRKTVLLIALALAWEAYSRWLDNPLLFPTFSSMLGAFIDAVASGTLPSRAWVSIKLLLLGYAAGVFCATVLTIVAITTGLGTALLGLLTSMFNPR